MTTQYDKIAKALRNDRCTTLDLMHVAGTTCPWKRIAEMLGRGWDIRRGYVIRSGKPVRAWWIDAGNCDHCGQPNPPGKAKRFCSAKCRAKHYRKERR